MPLPNNYEVALRRERALDANLKRDAAKRDHFEIFMMKLFDNDHAEEAPTIQSNQEQWFLPLFGVYHPQKPNQIRGVFDSSAKFREAIDLMCKTQDAMKQYGNLRLHKVATNSEEVMKAFEPQDLAQDIYDLNLDEDQLVQRSLGI